jgi:hypothetical protein
VTTNLSDDIVKALRSAKPPVLRSSNGGVEWWRPSVRLRRLSPAGSPGAVALKTDTCGRVPDITPDRSREAGFNIDKVLYSCHISA